MSQRLKGTYLKTLIQKILFKVLGFFIELRIIGSWSMFDKIFVVGSQWVQEI